MAVSEDQFVAAQEALYFFTGEGYEPGNFHHKLIQLFCCADQTNQHKLLLVFPAVCEAVNLGKNHADGLDILRGRVREFIESRA